MFGEAESEGNEVRKDTEDSSNEDTSPITVNGNEEKEGAPAKVGASHPEEKSATSEAEENSGDELPAVDAITTSKDSGVKMDEHGDSVVFEINSSDEDDGPSRLHLETPGRESTASPAQDEEEELTAASAGSEDTVGEEHTRVPRGLCEERDEASRRGGQLQAKLSEHLRKKAGDGARPGRRRDAELLQEYEKYVNMLTDLKQQIAADSEAAQQQAEELRLQSHEKVDKVENEWQEFMALKQHVAVAALTRFLGKQAAQDKVESALAAEQLRQDKLIELRLKHIKLKIKIQRLEAELRNREERGRDPLQLQFEQLRALKLEQRKLSEKQREESSKLQNKISSSLEVLSNVKEKLFWYQMEVQCKREQLAEVEAIVAKKKDLLTRTKQARSSLQRDNLRLKECQGLLGNRVLLQDFEKTVDASDHLEEQLENLKCRKAEINLKLLN